MLRFFSAGMCGLSLFLASCSPSEGRGHTLYYGNNARKKHAGFLGDEDGKMLLEPQPLDLKMLKDSRALTSNASRRPCCRLVSEPEHDGEERFNEGLSSFRITERGGEQNWGGI